MVPTITNSFKPFQVSAMNNCIHYTFHACSYFSICVIYRKHGKWTVLQHIVKNSLQEMDYPRVVERIMKLAVSKSWAFWWKNYCKPTPQLWRKTSKRHRCICWFDVFLSRFQIISCGCCSFIVTFIRFWTFWPNFWNLATGHFTKIGGELDECPNYSV